MGRCCLDEFKAQAPDHEERRPPQGRCAILPLTYYTRARECEKNEAKKRCLPSVAPSLTSGVQGGGFDPLQGRHRLSPSVLKLNDFHVPIFACCAFYHCLCG